MEVNSILDRPIREIPQIAIEGVQYGYKKVADWTHVAKEWAAEQTKNLNAAVASAGKTIAATANKICNNPVIKKVLQNVRDWTHVARDWVVANKKEIISALAVAVGIAGYVTGIGMLISKNIVGLGVLLVGGATMLLGVAALNEQMSKEQIRS